MSKEKLDASGNPVPPVWNGTEAVPMEVDRQGNFPTIDSVHRLLHKGLLFSFCDDLASTAVGDTDYLLSVPSDRTVHLISEVFSDNAGIVTIYEAPTITVNGSAQTPKNRNRASINTPGVLIYKGPTNTALGTMLCKERFWSGNKAGGEAREANEWILNANTKYLIRVTNSVINSNLDLKLDFYESLI